MFELPPKKKRPTILTRLKINEVSLVDRAAGEGCRVIISKRADDDIDDWYKKEVAEEDRHNGVHDSDWYREQAAIAERMNEEHVRKHAPTWRSFNEVLAENTAKSFAATARGDEADQHDEAVPVDEMTDGAPPPPDGVSDGVPRKHRPVTFDTVDGTRMKFPNERSLAERLSIQARIRKSSTSEDPTTMNSTERLRDLAKRYGVAAICKSIVDEDQSFSITEGELTELVIAEATQRYPELSAAQAFAEVYSEQSEQGTILRRAFNVAKNAAHVDDGADSAEAYRELEAIGERDYPGLPRHVQFAKAFEAHPELARRAHRRPGASTSFPFPKY